MTVIGVPWKVEVAVLAAALLMLWSVETLASAVDSGCDELSDPRQDGLLKPPEGQAQVLCAAFFPFAIAGDGVESTRLEVRINHTGVSSASIGNTFPIVSLSVEEVALPQTGAQIELFDDGTHGDRVGGDGIWSRNGFRLGGVPIPKLFMFEFDKLFYTDMSGSHEISLVGTGQYGPAKLGRIDPALRTTTESIGDGFHISKNAVFVIDNATHSELRWLIQASAPVADIRSVSRKFYERFPDVFDFLLLAPASHVARGLRGAHLASSNDVEGIGRATFDSSSDWGSEGKLQGLVAFNLADGGPFIHELSHRWGVFFGADLGLQQCAPAHVGLAGTGCGPIGGFKPETLVNNGNGTWTVSNNCFSTGGAAADTTTMNPLNLYLAGFIPASQVPVIKVPVNADCSSVRQDFSTQTVTFAADGMVDLTIDDIIDDIGVRVPSHTNSQRDFRLGWVVYLNRMPTSSEIGWFQHRAEYVGRNEAGDEPFRLTFWETTGGRATLNTFVGNFGSSIFSNGFESP